MIWVYRNPPHYLPTLPSLPTAPHPPHHPLPTAPFLLHPPHLFRNLGLMLEPSVESVESAIVINEVTVALETARKYVRNLRKHTAKAVEQQVCEQHGSVWYIMLSHLATSQPQPLPLPHLTLTSYHPTILPSYHDDEPNPHILHLTNVHYH